MSKGRVHSVAVLASCGMVLCGCITPQGRAAKDWSNMIREMQISPVFPPREDVQVGDVYSDPYPNREEEAKGFKAKDFLKIPILLHATDTRKELEAYYGTRVSFPKTIWATDDLGNVPDAKSSILEPVAPNDGSVFSSSISRIRHVGFPEYAYTDITVGDLQAFVPIQAITLLLNFTGSDFRSVSVKIRGAESYGLPKDVLLDVVNKDRVDWDDLIPEHPETKLKMARLIQEVYTSRDLEITATFKKSFGAKIDATYVKPPKVGTGDGADTKTPTSKVGENPDNPGDTQQQKEKRSGKTKESSQTSQVDKTNTSSSASAEDQKSPHQKPAENPLDPNAAPQARLNAIQQYLNSDIAQNEDGSGVLRVSSVSDRSITLMRHFYRPIVVGVRAIEIEPSGSGIQAVNYVGGSAPIGRAPAAMPALR